MGLTDLLPRRPDYHGYRPDDYTRDYARALERLADRLWYWEAVVMLAAETAADVAALLAMPLRDVALAYLRRSTAT